MRASWPGDRRSTILGALWAFWMLGFALASPRAGQAACSHPDRPGFGVAWEGVRPAAPAARIDPTTPEPPQPCEGPQCSGKSAPSPSSAALPRFLFDGGWAWIARGAGVDDLVRSTLVWPASRVVLPARDPSSIFHPPRRPR